MNLPILGATGPSGENGGASLAAIDRKYMVELTTADGAHHHYAFQMGRPVGPDGNIDLGALKAFNPPVDAIKAVVEQIGDALYAPPGKAPMAARMTTGEFIMWRHVTSFQYLGPADELTP